ncbi:MAG: double zinc ribbon domain-containing protein, partial [Candidatus Acidiferrales bacterium]
MSDRCNQCGAALTERDAFCTKCGAPRANAAQPVAAGRFCTKCGAPFTAETKFCTKCGAAVEISSGSAAENARHFLKEALAGASSSATVKAAPQTTVSPAPVAKSAAGIPKVAILGGAIVVFVILIAAVAGFIHAAHRARERAQEREAAENIEKSLNKSTADSKDSAAKRQQGSSSDAGLQKNLAEMQAAANALGATSGNPGANGATSNSGAANATPAASAKASAPYGWTLENGKLVPAKAPEAPPLPKADPVEPVAATGNQAYDWALKYERTLGGPEADLVVRTGDINNLGFGWPQGFDPFSGQSTPPHQWPDINKIPPGAPDGTDRIMLGTSVMPVHMVIRHTAGQADKVMVDSIVKMIGGDGYSGSLGDCFSIRNHLPISIRDNPPPDGRLDQLPNYLQIATVPTEYVAGCTRERQLTMPTPIVLPVGALPAKIDSVLFQIFVDDFQAPGLRSHFQVDLNGTRIPTIESAINSIDQSGPIGQLVTVKLLPEYWPLLKSGTAKLLFDDPTT